MNESETINAVKRAGSRVIYHLLRAGVESLKAVEALVDELGKVGRSDDEPPDPDTPGRVRIELD